MGSDFRANEPTCSDSELGQVLLTFGLLLMISDMGDLDLGWPAPDVTASRGL